MSDPLQYFFSNAWPAILPVILPVWQVVVGWWWLVLPFILWKPFTFLWQWWRVDIFLSKQKSILLEVRMPKEILKPIRAMEIVFEHLWQILYDPPGNFWEIWIDGQIVLSYYLEIVSIGGDPHFFIKIPEANKQVVEATIYSQYPEAEISVAEDYTKKVPQDIPNKDWDIWGCDYKLLRPNPYPIKTYMKFETEHEAKEEKRIDPLADLLEIMAKIGPGEQLWIQIGISPVRGDLEVPWIPEGEKIRDKIARRIAKENPQNPMAVDIANILVTGDAPKEAEKEKDIIPPEMKLTPGEREVLAAVEQKMTKRGFSSHIRFAYLGKKDVFFKPKLRLALSFFSTFATQNLNALYPYGKPLITKIPKSWFLPLNLLRDRRLYLRKRSLFRKYLMRVGPFFPLPSHWPSSFILNTEEIATIFHFPGRNVAPAPFERVESKKGEAPPGLPVE